MGPTPASSLLPPDVFPSVRYVVPFLLGLVLAACSPSGRDAPPQQTQVDTLSRYPNGAPRAVAVQRGDSVIERRTYRHTGTLRRVNTADSVRTYFDLHDPDSAAILKDYLQGRWRNLSADTSREQSSAFYTFDADELTFEAPDGAPLESIQVTYEKNRTLVTEEGMSVRAEIASFDTVRVTGYTLVRLAPPDSL